MERFSDSPEAIERSIGLVPTPMVMKIDGVISQQHFMAQNGKGQFHQNCYSKGKIRKMLSKVGFEVTKIEEFRWKTDRDFMLQVNSKKVKLLCTGGSGLIGSSFLKNIIDISMKSFASGDQRIKNSNFSIRI